jgi:hypothetical protein
MVRFQVLTAASMKMAVFWDVAQCSLVEIDRRFRGLTAFVIRAIALMMEAVRPLKRRSISGRLHGATSQ